MPVHQTATRPLSPRPMQKAPDTPVGLAARVGPVVGPFKAATALAAIQISTAILAKALRLATSTTTTLTLHQL